jgi:hypothetical protein
MEQSERNPSQERDRSRKPGSPSIDRLNEIKNPDRSDEKGRDRAPARPTADGKRDPDDPWMGG